MKKFSTFAFIALLSSFFALADNADARRFGVSIPGAGRVSAGSGGVSAGSHGVGVSTNGKSTSAGVSGVGSVSGNKNGHGSVHTPAG
ncbi:MAG TPA: hypothetical protein V6C96_02435, partial [Vampirovibrionales bacterium]